MVEAVYYEARGDKIRNAIYPTAPFLADGEECECFGYKNIGGKLYAINYGRLVTASYEPMEKKPFFHYYPNSIILSIAHNGSNVRGPLCENPQLSLKKRKTKEISLQTLLDYSGKSQSIGVAYTFTEPLLWYEFIFDATRKLKGIGQKNVLVTNGCVNEKPIADIVPYIDAIHVKVKSMREETYKKYVGAELSLVLNSIKAVHKQTHLELSFLLIPTVTDSDKEIHDFVDFVAALDPSIPVHFRRYFPDKRLPGITMTPNDSMIKAYKIAREKLEYIYLTDTDIDGVSDTFCPKCKRLIIKRRDYQSNLGGLRGHTCKFCGHGINIKF